MFKKSQTIVNKGSKLPEYVGGPTTEENDEAYQRALKEAGDGMWLDKDFMPDAKSLIPNWSDPDEGVQALVPTWKNI